MADIKLPDDEKSQLWYARGRVQGRHEIRMEYAAERQAEKDWMLKIETTHYRCGCVSEVRAISGQPGGAPRFHHSGQRCEKHATEFKAPEATYGSYGYGQP